MNQTTTSINDRLAACHRSGRHLFPSWGSMLVHALHMYWRERYGEQDTLARMSFSKAKVD